MCWPFGSLASHHKSKNDCLSFSKSCIPSNIWLWMAPVSLSGNRSLPFWSIDLKMFDVPTLWYLKWGTISGSSSQVAFHYHPLAAAVMQGDLQLHWAASSRRLSPTLAEVVNVNLSLPCLGAVFDTLLAHTFSPRSAIAILYCIVSLKNLWIGAYAIGWCGSCMCLSQPCRRHGKQLCQSTALPSLTHSWSTHNSLGALVVADVSSGTVRGSKEHTQQRRQMFLCQTARRPCTHSPWWQDASYGALGCNQQLALSISTLQCPRHCWQ
jgi:hypothetical protein